MFLCICHVPELSIFFLFQLNSFLLSLVHIIPLLTPVVTCAHKRNSTSLEVLSYSFIEHIWADSAPTCHSRGRGILQNPRGSSAAATKSHLRISSPKREKRGNVKQQCLCFYLPCLKNNTNNNTLIKIPWPITGRNSICDYFIFFCIHL